MQYAEGDTQSARAHPHHHLYVREKVERGMQAINEGRIVSQEEAERKVQEWWNTRLNIRRQKDESR